MNLRVLLIESRAEEALFLRDVLTELDGASCWTDWVHLESLHASTWADGAAILGAEPVDIVLLDPDLDDCQGIETFHRLQAVAPHLPVILLVESSDIVMAERLVRDGAQDFLMKKEVDSVPLAHAIRNAMDRHRLLAAARATSMTDTLTGLMNQRTFTIFADRDRGLAERLNRRMTILVAKADLEGVANGYGEQRRDLALIEAADSLRKLAGPMDLVAHLGDGRFGLAVFETDAESAEETSRRLHSAAARHGIVAGAAIFDPESPVSLDSLLAQAALDMAPGAAAAHR